MVKPIIFISAVSEEFRGLRRDVADVLRKLGYDPHSQESLPTLEGDLRQALRKQIDQCEGVIQIVGAAYGAEPPIEDENFGRCSYTQFEYHYARLKGKKLWTFFATVGDNVGRDKPIAQLDLPRSDANARDPMAYQAERRQLQQRYIARLRSNGQTRHGFSEKAELLNQIHGVRDELLLLRRQWEVTRNRVSRIQFGVATLLVLAVVAVLPAGLSGELMRQMCQVPVAHGVCRAQGWGGVPTLADEERFAEAASEGCPGLRAYLNEPDPHPLLSQRADRALKARVVGRMETWEIKDNQTHLIRVGFGTAPFTDDEQSARKAALRQAQTLAERHCLLPTAGEDFRSPQDRAAAVLRDIECACEQVRARYHCQVRALAQCQLERRTYVETENCHVAE